MTINFAQSKVCFYLRRSSRRTELKRAQTLNGYHNYPARLAAYWIVPCQLNPSSTFKMYPPYAFEAYVDAFCSEANDARDLHINSWSSPHSPETLLEETSAALNLGPMPALQAPSWRAPIPYYPPLLNPLLVDCGTSRRTYHSTSSAYSPLSWHLEEQQTPCSSGRSPAPGGSHSTGLHCAASQAPSVHTMEVALTVTRPEVASAKMRLASAKRRGAPARFTCPLFECGSTFTKKHNLESGSARGLASRPHDR